MRARVWVAVAAILLLGVVGCTATAQQTETVPQRKSSPEVRVLASWTGRELDAFRDVLAPFEGRTGIKVEYTASRDLPGALQHQIDIGQPPDITGLSGPVHMATLARANALRNLGEEIDLRAYKAAVAPTFVDLGTVDGRLVGVFLRSTVKGLIWYDPKVHGHEAPETWAELELMAVRMGAIRPWCAGLASQESSGWPGTDWIEDFLLRQSGLDAYDAWVGGRLPWTSPEVARAWRSYGKVVSEETVFGGIATAIGTEFSDAGDPLFNNPPGCLFLHQGSFMPTFWLEQGLRPGQDFDFFPFPEVEPANAGAIIGAGDLFGLVTDDPSARLVIEYLVSPEAQRIWVSKGGALSVNQGVTEYPDRVQAKAADVLTSADEFRFDASDLMPEQLNTAFWKGVLEYTRDQSNLPVVLRDLEAARVRLYGE